MKVTTREVKFRDPNGRMVSSLVIGNGSLHDEVADYLDNNPEPVATATGEWLTENITQPTTPVVDTSLAVQGAAADSAKVGQELTELKSQIDQMGGGGLTVDIKQALLDCFKNVMFINGDNSSYSNLYDALFAVTAITLNTSSISLQSIGATSQLSATTTPAGANVSWSSSNDSVATVDQTGLVTSVGYGSATITATAGNVSATCEVLIAQATVTSISAVYTQTGTVYDTDSLESLRNNLVVTANWSDSTSSTVSDYTLSGALTVGTSTITVNYGGESATFTVAVTEKPKVTVVNGALPSSDGSESPSTTMARTDYIPVANATFTLEGLINDSLEISYMARYYNSSKTFLGASKFASITPQKASPVTGSSWMYGDGTSYTEHTASSFSGTPSYVRLLLRSTLGSETITNVSGTITVSGVEYAINYEGE